MDATFLLRFANISILPLTNTELSKVMMAASLVQSALHPHPSALNTGAAFLPCPAAWSKRAQLQGSGGSAFSGRTKGSIERGGNCREKGRAKHPRFPHSCAKDKNAIFAFYLQPLLVASTLSTTYGCSKRACVQL